MLTTILIFFEPSLRPQGQLGPLLHWVAAWPHWSCLDPDLVIWEPIGTIHLAAWGSPGAAAQLHGKSTGTHRNSIHVYKK